MIDQDVKEKILQLIEKNSFCVVSTVNSQNIPESALVGFVHTENIEIIFGTSNTSRKYKNLTTRDAISVVIGFDGIAGSVQLEGTTKEIRTEDYLKYAELLIQKEPASEKYVHRDDQRYFLITPSWIRFINSSDKDIDGNSKIYEVKF